MNLHCSKGDAPVIFLSTRHYESYLERESVERLPPLDWPAGKCMEIFLTNDECDGATVGGATPR